MSAQINAKATKEKMPGGITGKGFVPGQSGNPGGRPKKVLGGILEEVLREFKGKGKNKKTFARLIVEAAVKRAIRKSDTMVREIFERIDGKIPQAVEVSGPDGEAFPVSASAIREELETLLEAAREGGKPPAGKTSARDKADSKASTSRRTGT